MARNRKLRAATVGCAVAMAAVTGFSTSGSSVAAVGAGARDVRMAAASAYAPDPFKGLSADEIGDRAVRTTQAAKSLRMAGRIESDGQPLAVDFFLAATGECKGTLKTEGGTAELRKIDEVAYLKGDEKFWRVSMGAQGVPDQQADATIELLKGRWLKIAGGEAGEELAGVCDLKALLADLDKDRANRRGLTRGPDTKVAGRPVATLVKKKADGEKTTVSIAKTGKPYIVKIVKAGGDEPGTLVLSAFNKPVSVAVPPADETVDVSKLDQGTGAAV